MSEIPIEATTSPKVKKDYTVVKQLAKHIAVHVAVGVAIHYVTEGLVNAIDKKINNKTDSIEK